MGEGLHLYKIGGRYYILSAWYEGRMRMPCARADKPAGTYAANLQISADEDHGLREGYRLRSGPNPPFNLVPPDPASRGRMSLHQGGIVDTANGDWFFLTHHGKGDWEGRAASLLPVTRVEGWPIPGPTDPPRKPGPPV